MLVVWHFSSSKYPVNNELSNLLSHNSKPLTTGHTSRTSSNQWTLLTLYAFHFSSRNYTINLPFHWGGHNNTKCFAYLMVSSRFSGIESTLNHQFWMCYSFLIMQTVSDFYFKYKNFSNLSYYINREQYFSPVTSQTSTSSVASIFICVEIWILVSNVWFKNKKMQQWGI